jgi:hypothetical protein
MELVSFTGSTKVRHHKDTSFSIKRWIEARWIEARWIEMIWRDDCRPPES